MSISKIIFYIIVSTSVLNTGCKLNHQSLTPPSIIILLVDYDTNQFEGGATILLNTGKKVFEATMIWMGTGHIEYPSDFKNEDEYERIEQPVPLPDKFEDFRYVLEEEDWVEQRIKAWDAINKLSIVKNVINPAIPVGTFLYCPTHGMIDWKKAKWIFFLVGRQKPGRRTIEI